MADGDETPTIRRLRAAVPSYDGPLASSGAAPDESSESRHRLPAPREAGPTTPDDAEPQSQSGTDPAPALASTGSGPQPTDDPEPTTDGPRPPAGQGSPAGTGAGPTATDGPTPPAGAEGDPEPTAGLDPPPDPTANPAAETDRPETDRPGAGQPGTGQPGAASEQPGTGQPGAASEQPGTGQPGAATEQPKAGTEDSETGDKPETGKTEDAAGAGAAEPDAAPAGGTGTGEQPDSGAEPIRRRRRIRVPFAHAARRMPPPRQVAAATGRWFRAWSRRPSGRLTLPGLLLLALVAVTAVGGAIVIPRIAAAPNSAAVDASPTTSGPEIVQPAPAGPALTLGPTSPPTATTPPPGGIIDPRPAAVLAGWAQQTGSRVGVPPVAMQAYGYAELVLAQTTPGCQLKWTTLAAVGLVESQHGQYGDSSLTPDGRASPPIIGPVLNGTAGNRKIIDTDGGTLDADTAYDHAVGPMQFIPSTWRDNGIDADNDGQKNPQDIDDAALAAGNYLCKNGRNLAVGRDWWNAILSYNDVLSYAQSVFDTANRYGTASRT